MSGAIGCSSAVLGRRGHHLRARVVRPSFGIGHRWRNRRWSRVGVGAASATARKCASWQYFGVEQVAHPVADEVEAQHRNEDEEPGTSDINGR